ncbi:hypothetical protein I6J42_07675 [Streptomyces californicus]|uniref:Integrase n=1 Tax=Streptomyces californicus TaxID=67351 RepID=A0ABD7CS76_9ACTN|nr:hypothetical protein [Streptomyces californicus]QRV33957.1 hypothetical protein I6J42_07675 [Streptomyces californicus]QRV50537.1 hypothetical protein I6J43_25965 [Streptomyces californicus]
MTGRGRKAAMPPKGYRRPSRLDETGLVFRPVDQYGLELGVYDFTDCPGPEEFRRELVAAFVARGQRTWNSHSSYYTHAKAVRGFMIWACELDPPMESISQLTPGLWKLWRLHSSKWRTMTIVLDESSALSAEARTAVTARIRRPKPKTKQGYSRAELKAIRTAAAKTVRTARLRIAENTALLERWRAGEVEAGTEDDRWGSLLDYIARTGDVPRYPCRQLRPEAKALTRESGGFADAVTRLFPSENEMGAAVILMVCHEAWNLSVVKTMQVPTHWPNADGDEAEPAIHHVETDKPRRRRRRHSTNNLVNVGPDSAGGAMQQVLEITAQARLTAELIGEESTSLFLGRSLHTTPEDGLFVSGSSAEWAVQGWVRRTRREDAGFPAGVAVSPVRHAVQVIHGGPRNNTPRVHRDAYLMRDARVREDAADVVADGLADAVARARADLRIRVVGQATGCDEHDADQVAKETGIDRETAAEVVAGRLDTAVAACTDFEHSPFTPAGPCAVSFLLCFACPNALATGRHLPRILYLFEALEALRSAVPAAVWKADWADHYERVKDLRRQHTTEAGRPALLAQLVDRDKGLVDRMLERRLDS